MNLTPYHANTSHTRTSLESHSYITENVSVKIDHSAPRERGTVAVKK